GRQGARPDGVAIAAEPADRLHADRLGEPAPVHRRGVIGLPRVEQLAVLDEEQRVDQERWHEFEAAVDLLRIARYIERSPLAGNHLERRARLLAILDRKSVVEGRGGG